MLDIISRVKCNFKIELAKLDMNLLLSGDVYQVLLGEMKLSTSYWQIFAFNHRTVKRRGIISKKILLQKFIEFSTSLR